MCGIVGYVGPGEAPPLLLEGLKRLEYRGYDSAGVSITNGNGLETRKAAGKISKLEAVMNGKPLHGTVGIAHTRWATHGPPTECNAHPHHDCTNTIAVVHNGIIENASTLKAELEARGHRFRSETDTEVLAHLIEAEYEDDLEGAVIDALRKVEGTYGIAVVSSRDPDKIVAARKGSPLLIGLGDGEFYVASDASAVLAHTRQVVYLDDGDLAVLERTGFRVIDMNAAPMARTVSSIDWDLDMIERGGFAHFVLKACGTSWHSALIGEFMIEELARIPVEVEYASEFRYRNPVVTDKTLCIVISQSGETADTLAAMREAKRRGARTLGIVNVVGSTMAREDDGGIYIHAGPEIGVASTKAFTSQVIALALFTLKLARKRDLSVERGRAIAQAMQALPRQVREILARASEIERLADQFTGVSNFL